MRGIFVSNKNPHNRNCREQDNEIDLLKNHYTYVQGQRYKIKKTE